MLSWIVRLILIGAGFISEWFVTRDSLNFGLIQAVVTMLMVALIVAVMAFWPRHWSERIDRKGREPRS
jgi:formate hydrogenlyase subunit 3/multisubunit Na+/H+ antiporter MnhD subunit